jgi:hypothetical protein
MWRICLLAVAVLDMGSAVSMWFTPHTWYNTVPGVAMMGPFNLHFIRDVALAFLMSAGALAYGAWRADRTAAVIGAAWPCLHALFHIWIWIMCGLPFDQIAVVNLIGIQLPSWLALAAALNFSPREPRT